MEWKSHPVVVSGIQHHCIFQLKINICKCKWLLREKAKLVRKLASALTIPLITKMWNWYDSLQRFLVRCLSQRVLLLKDEALFRVSVKVLVVNNIAIMRTYLLFSLMLNPLSLKYLLTIILGFLWGVSSTEVSQVWSCLMQRDQNKNFTNYILSWYQINKFFYQQFEFNVDLSWLITSLGKKCLAELIICAIYDQLMKLLLRPINSSVTKQ